ncbi:MAG: DUF4091 domain-containing protein [Oscillospiraceae bacterium]|nr:DUF4091 domain-containing protein [Oscillospiraceae bacterium]
MRKYMKRAVSLVLTLALSLSVFAGCKSEKEAAKSDSKNDVQLWYAYNTENHMKDLAYPELIAERDSTLRMNAIRNDVETVQLMITPSNNVLSYDFQVGDLKNANGDVFKAENIALYAAWYVEILESYMADAYYGYYPDALVPFENFKQLKHNYIAAGQNQSIWVEASVPADQAAGLYTGTGELDVDGVKYSVPIELMVYDADMPAKNNVKTSIGIWYDYIPLSEGYYTAELAEAYYDFLLSKRISPMKATPTKWNLGTEYEAYVQWLGEEAAVNPMISTYALPYAIETYELGSIVSREGVKKLLTMMAEKNIELREAGNETIDLFDKAFYYLGGIVDEPSGDKIQVVRDCDLIITECKYEVANTYFKDKYPDLYASCLGVQHLVTSAFSEDLIGSDTVGGVQTWCGQASTWHTEAQRQELADRRASTDRVNSENTWWYTCEQPRNPFINFHLDDDLLNTRTICWMMFDYGVEGMIYWSINYHTSENIWEIPVDYLDAVGDGVLCYPGAQYGIQGPISTLRLENIRESIEDYECLLMIKNHILAYNEANGTDYDPAELMAWLYADLYEGVIPERDNAEGFAQQRATVLEVLAQFTTDADGAIDTLLEG